MTSSCRQRFALRQRVEGDGFVRVVVLGELDVATADILHDRLRAFGHAGRAVLLDLSAVRFIDARGLRAVISSVADAIALGCELRVDRNLSDCVARLLELTGATDYVWPPPDPGQSFGPGLDCLPRRPAGSGTASASSCLRGSGGRPPRRQPTTCRSRDLRPIR